MLFAHKMMVAFIYSVPAGGQVTTTAAPVTAMPTTPQPGVITSKPVGKCTSIINISVWCKWVKGW